MYILYTILSMLFVGALSYPFLKFYQLSGYDIKVFLRDFFKCPYKFDDKNKLVFTKRMTRFVCLYACLLFLFYFLIFFFVSNVWLIILDFFIILIFSPVVILFAHLLIWPIEEMIKKTYIKRAKKRLDNFRGIKIAIVGSFGKTSVKNILSQLLSDRFKVVITPKNFNTPMGICKTVFSELKDDTEIAIFEMGARHEGDIKELMEIVNPQFGIMTAVGEQHIETFGDLSAVKRAKFELVKYMSYKGKVVFNGASENTKELYEKCDKRKFLACDESGLAWAKNLRYDANGLSFDLHIKENHAKVCTKLLGKFNCENIVVSSLAANLLGLSFGEIVKKISTLQPAESRLQLLNNGRFTIIDDSYNANPVGAKEALDVLRCFEGEKIVITSGLVELGSLQYEKNFNLGKEIALVADKVIVMNETNKNAILSGLKSAKFEESKIFFANTREQQKALITRLATLGCVVLFQNDLPDSYK